MKAEHVLLVEENEKTNVINRHALLRAGYDVMVSRTLGEARAILTRHKVGVILLDTMLPDGCGMAFCGEIRDRGMDTHILFLSSLSGQGDRLRALAMGGDDYITKPYDIEELLARIQAAMRRRGMGQQPPKTLRHGHLTLNTFAGRAFVDGEDLMLSTKEFALLHLLLQHENQVLSVATIYEEIWETPMNGDNRPLKTRICGLRKKMDCADCEYTINAVYGQGYCFERV